MIKSLISFLPILIVWLDLVVGVVKNITYRLPKIEQSDLATILTPDIAINWVHVLVSAGMLLILSVCFIVLFKLNNNVIKKKPSKLGFFSYCCLIILLFFGLPALWEVFFLVIDSIRYQRLVIDASWYYVVVALCLPYVFLLTAKRLFDNRRLQ